MIEESNEFDRLLTENSPCHILPFVVIAPYVTAVLALRESPFLRLSAVFSFWWCLDSPSYQYQSITLLHLKRPWWLKKGMVLMEYWWRTAPPRFAIGRHWILHDHSTGCTWISFFHVYPTDYSSWQWLESYNSRLLHTKASMTIWTQYTCDQTALSLSLIFFSQRQNTIDTTLSDPMMAPPTNLPQLMLQDWWILGITSWIDLRMDWLGGHWEYTTSFKACQDYNTCCYKVKLHDAMASGNGDWQWLTLLLENKVFEDQC